ncbi:hypothetical protein BSKO_09169 [Bryopsis sp. KO-2023]|nr:hypothetical protein BSKO_09169 [Bryopsis sp. KO-2023]
MASKLVLCLLFVAICRSLGNEADHSKDWYDRDYSMEKNGVKKSIWYSYDGEDGYEYHNSAKWRAGRSTFFGDRPLDNLNKGSCGYGSLQPHKGTGLDIAAISDRHYEYYGSCGRCFEVKCRPTQFYDKYGNFLERNTACHDPNKIITVTITDVCPCYDPLPWNTDTNQRWCCGDMDHFDLSYNAFGKLSPMKWGVIGMWYRPVNCPTNEFPNRHHHEDHLKPGYREKFDQGKAGRKLLDVPGVEILSVRSESDTSPHTKSLKGLIP